MSALRDVADVRSRFDRADSRRVTIGTWRKVGYVGET